MKPFKKLLSLLLSALVSLPLSGCASEQASSPAAPQTSFSEASASFAVKLLRMCYDSTENLVLSPYSAMAALSLTANGAQGETLAQMEAVLGLPADALNEAFRSAPMGQEAVSANSVWIHETPLLSVKEPFLQAVTENYDAQTYRAAFDAQTVADINAWVAEHTDGRITQMLDSIPDNTMLFLLNALAFDAHWAKEYTAQDCKEGDFFTADGSVQTAQYLCGKEAYYLDDGMATGFLKDYAGSRYRFVALLPNEGVSMQDYLASLTGESLLRTVQNAEQAQVAVQLPKLRVQSEKELNEVLSAMGMPLAFDCENADLTGIAEIGGSRLYVSSVLQKTSLTVDEAGTQASASTQVTVQVRGAARSTRSVTLNRPFVMAVYDNETQTFLFLGVIHEIQE